MSPTTYRYKYFLKDHLGNTRIVISPDTNADGDPEVSQSSHYYPFGMNFTRPTDNENRRLYNGKELQTELNIDLIDYGARFYDAQLGRWWSVDAMAEARSWVSPYNYCQNNPISRIDPDGNLDGDYYLNNGIWIGSDGKKDGKHYVIKEYRSAAELNKYGKHVAQTSQLGDLAATDSLKDENEYLSVAQTIATGSKNKTDFSDEVSDKVVELPSDEDLKSMITNADNVKNPKAETGSMVFGEGNVVHGKESKTANSFNPNTVLRKSEAKKLLKNNSISYTMHSHTPFGIAGPTQSDVIGLADGITKGTYTTNTKGLVYNRSNGSLSLYNSKGTTGTIKIDMKFKTALGL